MLVSAERIIIKMVNLGGTAECFIAFRPSVDGRFLFVIMSLQAGGEAISR